ncbi:MAG TPA: hypothetical protein VEP69_03640, partial [Thermodesulfovibrionales bacterium]|nr:hypothetical protein [Thermodesulfovibrionales bacterium]
MTSCAEAAEPVSPAFRDEDLSGYRRGQRVPDVPQQHKVPDNTLSEKDRETISRENDRSVCAIVAYNAEGRGFSHGSC